jgi:hypothetical protein
MNTLLFFCRQSCPESIGIFSTVGIFRLHLQELDNGIPKESMNGFFGIGQFLQIFVLRAFNLLTKLVGLLWIPPICCHLWTISIQTVSENIIISDS